ncbi:hypothetical protein B0A50_02460 [Salinomyces thailandicus]|uniref:Neutral ceramidase n=1 Tax=Salinomyces thailandicus TaxID=706561 RepID=A0A4U0U6C7_9PEZI|nr:hypothetical protein B0A50_02460 [Salinomyces thailandica]
MARSPLLVAVAAGLLIVLSTIGLLQQYSPISLPWNRPQSLDPLLNAGRPLGESNDGHALGESNDGHPLGGSNDEHHPLHKLLAGNGTDYLLGVGKADITGPVVEINFMGYADTKQVGSGVRQRLYSRAFIIGDVEKPEDRFVYLVLDTQSGDTAVRHGILEALAGLGGEYSMYGQQNVAVTGTHSHSGPGAWLNYLLPQITSYGFHKPSYHAIVDGAVASITKAHKSLAVGRLSLGEAEVHDGNTNRSPYAYLANPGEERARYEHNVDKTMTVLRFTHVSPNVPAKDVGILTWFPVHGTSMYGNNTLVTGDNKGVAAWLFEKSMTTNDSDDGNDDGFVAGFSQANVGDTSPNVQGAYCEFGDFAGEQCDFKTSLCGNKSQPCHGRGPYWGRHDAGAASTFEIGRRQHEAARQLWKTEGAWKPVTGQIVRSSHRFVDLSTYSFTLPNGTEVSTCPAALGYSFAAGTTDGPGAFDFKQAQPGDPHANPLWSSIGNRIHIPNDTQKACHGEKVILLDVGESSSPYAWSPNIIDIQLQRVGNLFIILAPGEATTMTGRRWKAALQQTASNDGSSSTQQPTVVLGGPANTYAHYIATPEEYSIQRYEGASTLFGPHTLPAYLDLTLSALPSLSPSRPQTPANLTLGPNPPIQVNQSYTFITPVIVDRPPLFKAFGALKSDVHASYKPGDTVSAKFVAANPRNNLRLGATFAAVEKFDYAALGWRRVRDDGDWGLVFEWRRTSTVAGTSEVRISWETGWETGDWRREEEEVRGEDGSDDDEEGHGELLAVRRRGEGLRGLYRLRYFGDAKGFGGGITAFEGVSGEFRIE